MQNICFPFQDQKTEKAPIYQQRILFVHTDKNGNFYSPSAGW